MVKNKQIKSEDNKKTCFVIAPIGADDSPTRTRSDKVLQHIIKAALEPNYKCTRADEISHSGSITKQVIDNILSADIVVADLSGLNPNVFYELAIRHMIRKPCIHLIQKGETLPFDIKDTNTITIDSDVSIVENAKMAIKRQIDTIENNSANGDSLMILLSWDKICQELRPHIQLPDINKDTVYNGHKFTLFRTRDKMIEYFDIMWNKATKGDEIWAQGVGRTSYTPNMVEKLQQLIDIGVSVKFIVNENSDHADEFIERLNKVPALHKRIAKNTVRLHGLSEKEVIISLPSTEAPYEAFVIQDKELTKALKQWFDARFNDTAREIV